MEALQNSSAIEVILPKGLQSNNVKSQPPSVPDLVPNNYICSLNLEPISPSISEHEDSDSVRVKETSELVPSTSEPVQSISEPVQGTSGMTKGIPEPVPGIPEPIPEPVPGIPEPIPEPIPNTPATDILKELVNNLDSGLLD